MITVLVIWGSIGAAAMIAGIALGVRRADWQRKEL